MAKTGKSVRKFCYFTVLLPQMISFPNMSDAIPSTMNIGNNYADIQIILVCKQQVQKTSVVLRSMILNLNKTITMLCKGNCKKKGVKPDPHFIPNWRQSFQIHSVLNSGDNTSNRVETVLKELNIIFTTGRTQKLPKCPSNEEWIKKM